MATVMKPEISSKDLPERTELLYKPKNEIMIESHNKSSSILPQTEMNKHSNHPHNHEAHNGPCSFDE
jgi:hypothetical protein